MSFILFEYLLWFQSLLYPLRPFFYFHLYQFELLFRVHRFIERHYRVFHWQQVACFPCPWPKFRPKHQANSTKPAPYDTLYELLQVDNANRYLKQTFPSLQDSRAQHLPQVYILFHHKCTFHRQEKLANSMHQLNSEVIFCNYHPIFLSFPWSYHQSTFSQYSRYPWKALERWRWTY